MIVQKKESHYRVPLYIYVRQKDGEEKLCLWAGLSRKGICIAYDNNNLYLIKNSQIIFKTKQKGEYINGDPSDYELYRSIKGYYILKHNDTNIIIRPGRDDDDYFNACKYTIFDENGSLVEKWNHISVGIDKYPKELGLGLVELDNIVYELDTLAPLFKIPPKFKVENIFSKDGILELDVIGDYRNLYVQVKNGCIISQHKEEELEQIVEALRNKRLDFLKHEDYKLYGNLPSFKASIEYLNNLGVETTNVKIPSSIYDKPYICNLSWTQIQQSNQLPVDAMRTISSIYQSLLSLNINDPTITSYVFRFSEKIYCRVLSNFILLSNQNDELIFFSNSGNKLSNQNYKCHWRGNNEFYPFETHCLFAVDKKHRYVQLVIENDSIKSKATYKPCIKNNSEFGLSLYFDPEYTRGFLISKECHDREKAILFSSEELNKFIEIRDLHKNSKNIYSITYGIFCKFFKDNFIIFSRLSDNETNDDWRLWIYNYDGKLLNTDYFIIKGLYLANCGNNYIAPRFIVFNKITNKSQDLLITKDHVISDETEIKPKMSSVETSTYLEVKVKERIKDYLYTLDYDLIDLKDYGCGWQRGGTNDFRIIEHYPGKTSISMNGSQYKIHPIKRDLCLDEIYYRHQNRPNFISSVELIDEYQTTEGLIELYMFQCTPYAICDTDGNIFYNFNIDEISL